DGLRRRRAERSAHCSRDRADCAWCALRDGRRPRERVGVRFRSGSTPRLQGLLRAERLIRPSKSIGTGSRDSKFRTERKAMNQHRVIFSLFLAPPAPPASACAGTEPPPAAPTSMPTANASTPASPTVAAATPAAAAAPTAGSSNTTPPTSSAPKPPL